MRVFTLLALASLALPSSAQAQKRCTKGIPCGNSCIAANKVCRIGSSAPAPRAATAPPVVSTRRMAAVPEDSIGAPRQEWVASKKGRTYYRVGCGGANGLAKKNVIHFATEDEALLAGYTRSRAKGC